MSARDDALRLALDALEQSQKYVDASSYSDHSIVAGWGEQLERAESAIAAIRAALAAAAEYDRVNPLGGPAVMFDAIADRLRAGDPFDSVMRDYGITIASDNALAEQPSAEPVATLHDDGHFTWKRNEFRLKYDREQVGWRMDVYAAPPQPSAEPVAWIDPAYKRGKPYPEGRGGSPVTTYETNGWTPLYTTPPAAPQPSAEPVAWLTPELDRVITAITRAGAIKDGGAIKSSTDPYSIPAYPASAIAAARAAARAAGRVEGLEQAAKVCEQIRQERADPVARAAAGMCVEAIRAL